MGRPWTCEQQSEAICLCEFSVASLLNSSDICLCCFFSLFSCVFFYPFHPLQCFIFFELTLKIRKQVGILSLPFSILLYGFLGYCFTPNTCFSVHMSLVHLAAGFSAVNMRLQHICERVCVFSFGAP